MSWASHLDGMYLGAEEEAPQAAAEAAPESATELTSPNGNETTAVTTSSPQAHLLGILVQGLLVMGAAALITYLILRNKKR